MPYPWHTRMSVSAVKRRGRSGASGAAPDLTQCNLMIARKLSRLGRLAQRIHRRRHQRHHGDGFVDQQRK